MSPVLKSENHMSWGSEKTLATKGRLRVPFFPARQGVAHNIGWFSGMYLLGPVQQ
jgi:hypothetical protein